MTLPRKLLRSDVIGLEAVWIGLDLGFSKIWTGLD
jgi:hypothetical protein